MLNSGKESSRKEDVPWYEGGSTQDCVVLYSGMVSGTNDEDHAVLSSSRVPGSNLHVHTDDAPSDCYREVSAVSVLQPLATQVELPRLGLGKQQGFVDMSQVKEKVNSPRQLSNLWQSMKPCSEEDVQTTFSKGSNLSAKKGGQTGSMTSEAPVVTTPIQEMETPPELDSTPFLEIVFDVKGKEQRVCIFKRPLGAEFSKRSFGPTKVSKVCAQSYAGELGLEVGWPVKSVGGEDVSKKTFQQTQDAIKNGLMLLPVQPRNVP